MPFGLQTKSLIVGALLATVVAPKVLGAIAARKGK